MAHPPESDRLMRPDLKCAAQGRATANARGLLPPPRPALPRTLQCRGRRSRAEGRQGDKEWRALLLPLPGPGTLRFGSPHPCSDSGAGRRVQPTMVLTQARARALSAMSGKCRRSSTAADSSPPSCQARRIASAVTSSTTNMPGAWGRAARGTSQCGLHGMPRARKPTARWQTTLWDPTCGTSSRPWPPSQMAWRWRWMCSRHASMRIEKRDSTTRLWSPPGRACFARAPGGARQHHDHTLAKLVEAWLSGPAGEGTAEQMSRKLRMLSPPVRGARGLAAGSATSAPARPEAALDGRCRRSRRFLHRLMIEFRDRLGHLGVQQGRPPWRGSAIAQRAMRRHRRSVPTGAARGRHQPRNCPATCRGPRDLEAPPSGARAATSILLPPKSIPTRMSDIGGVLTPTGTPRLNEPSARGCSGCAARGG
jgi:hypothetical protein